MGSISKPYTFSPDTTASSSQVNADFDTIYNDYNGNISATNLAASAVTTAKIADSNVTTAKIADSNVTTAKIAADAVTATKIDWASTGADGGIWWEELGRTTLSGAGDTISVTSLPTRKYIMVIWKTLATGGTTNGIVRFNNDSGNNYANRTSTDGGADSTAGSGSSIFAGDTGTAAVPKFGYFHFENTAAQEKIVTGIIGSGNTAGAANVPNRREFTSKWANTTDAVSRIDMINSGTGDYAIGSEVIVLGHN